MIEVVISLRSARGKKHDRCLGVIVICNDGTGNSKVGNYEFAVSHSGNYFGKGKEPYKIGKVRKHRRSQSVYKLLAKVLKEVLKESGIEP